MSVDPYRSGMLKKSPYALKKDVEGIVVAVLDFATDKRGLHLITQPSRAVISGHVHELIITDDSEAGPDSHIDRVAYLAFIAICESGMLLQHDVVYLNDEKIGMLAGFDETHMPNHQNIVIKGESRSTGKERNIAIGDRFRFSMASSA